jgi:hypothetical protein
LQAANKYYGEKMGTYIDQLQAELLVTDRLPNDDVIFLALAGMKEIKDVLRGYIKPDPALIHQPCGSPAATLAGANDGLVAPFGVPALW